MQMLNDNRRDFRLEKALIEAENEMWITVKTFFEYMMF